MDKHDCKHFNGTRNSHCAAGVCYRDVTPDPDEPGSAFREPCRLPDGWPSRWSKERARAEVRGQCAKFELPTAAELAAAENDRKEWMERMGRAMKVVDRMRIIYAGKGFSGEVACPVCQGRLRVSIASCNGHAHVRCETPDCVRWIE